MYVGRPVLVLLRGVFERPAGGTVGPALACEAGAWGQPVVMRARRRRRGGSRASRASDRAAWFKDQLRCFARTALAEEWVVLATVDAMTAELDAWAERPDALSVGL